MLKRVSIQNFKSLKKVELKLQKINLLIGPNNSGKTNFLKAIELYRSGDFTSSRTDFLEQISYKHRRVDVKFEFDYEFDRNTYLAKSYNSQTDKLYHYVSELIVKDEDGYVPLSVSNNVEEWFLNEDGSKSSTEIMGGHRREFFEYMNSKIYKPDPSKLVQQVKFSADQVELMSDCSNLISFYFYVDANFRRNSKSIQENLSKCIPEIAYFTIPPVRSGSESMLGLQFFDKDDNSYWADEVSEGVLYFLALLCIINQPNPPKLLLLEEPEKGIHPRRIREVMDFIFRLAEEKDVQIILTTHNENVLNEFTSTPEAVFVFEKDEEGATHVKNLLRDIIEPSNQRSQETGTKEIDFTSNLGESWMYGLLGGVPVEAL